VRTAAHDFAVKLIQQAGNQLVLVVVTPDRPMKTLPTFTVESDLGDSLYAEILPRHKNGLCTIRKSY